jgi:hypothetical protein
LWERSIVVKLVKKPICVGILPFNVLRERTK